MSSIESNIESDIEYDLSTDDSDDDALNLPGLANDGVPGLLVSVEFDDSLSAPIIDNGKVRMPRGGGSSKLVEFGSGISSPISGVLVGMSFATGIDEIIAKNGEVYFPLAECTSAVCTVSSVPGAIAGVQTDSSITNPYISAGVLYLPAGGGQAEMATFEGTTSAVTGTLRAAMFSDQVDEISAYNGVLYFPKAQHSPILGTRLGAVCAATCDPEFPEGGIYGGVIYFPLTDSPAPAAYGCTVSSIPGALRGAMSDEYLAGGGIYNGMLYFPLADTNAHRPGFIRDVTRHPDYPLGGLFDGLLYFPTTAELRGVVDYEGYYHTWEQMEGYVGSKVPVAFVDLSVNGNYTIPLLLSVGYDGAGLRFFLSNSFPS